MMPQPRNWAEIGLGLIDAFGIKPEKERARGVHPETLFNRWGNDA